MTGAPDLWLYAAVVFGVIVLPGMDMAYVLSSGLLAGLRGAFTAVAGVVAGGVVHLVVAVTGMSAVLALVPALFNAILLAGAAYIAWIGGSLLRAPAAQLGTHASVNPALPRIFAGAMATCLLNPKAYLFTLAVVPLFLFGSTRPLALQAGLLIAITAATQMLVYGAVGVGAVQVGRWLAGSAGGMRWFTRAVGVLLIATAVLTAGFAWKRADAGRAASAPGAAAFATVASVQPSSGDDAPTRPAFTPAVPGTRVAGRGGG